MSSTRESNFATSSGFVTQHGTALHLPANCPELSRTVQNCPKCASARRTAMEVAGLEPASANERDVHLFARCLRRNLVTPTRERRGTAPRPSRVTSIIMQYCTLILARDSRPKPPVSLETNPNMLTSHQLRPSRRPPRLQCFAQCNLVNRDVHLLELHRQCFGLDMDIHCRC